MSRLKSFQKSGQPVVSVDTKKKEVIGDFANKGREYQPKGKREKVCVYDFADKKLGRAIPYGVYDLTANKGWVSVGTDHDTAQFAVETLRQWWRCMGSKEYPDATKLLVTADGGGSNGSRCRLWKFELQRLADETGLTITVCHFPPGTSKWNKIEHRMFCHITENWRGRPLINHEAIVNLNRRNERTCQRKIHGQILNSQTTGNLGKFLSEIWGSDEVLVYIDCKGSLQEQIFDVGHARQRSIIMCFPMKQR